MQTFPPPPTHPSQQQLPRLIVKPSLDYVTVSIRGKHADRKLFQALEGHGFRCSSDVEPEKGNFSRLRTYTDNGDRLEIFYGLKKIPGKSFPAYMPPVLMKIRHPNQEVMITVALIVRKNHLEIKVSEVEVTFDFFGDNTHEIRLFLNNHLFWKHKRKRTDWVKDTLYPSPPRKSRSRGGRVYDRDVYTDNEHPRLELVLKRDALHRLGLEFPLRNIDQVDWLRFFDFRTFNQKKLHRFIRQGIPELAFDPAVVGKIPALRALLTYGNRENFVVDHPSLMEKVERLRGNHPGIRYSNFLIPMPDVNRLFMEEVRKTRLIPKKADPQQD